MRHSAPVAVVEHHLTECRAHRTRHAVAAEHLAPRTARIAVGGTDVRWRVSRAAWQNPRPCRRTCDCGARRSTAQVVSADQYVFVVIRWPRPCGRCLWTALRRSALVFCSLGLLQAHGCGGLLNLDSTGAFVCHNSSDLLLRRDCCFSVACAWRSCTRPRRSSTRTGTQSCCSAACDLLFCKAM